MLKNILCWIPLLLFGIQVNAQAPCPTGQKEVEIVIVPDNFPTETTWELRTAAGALLVSGGSTGQTLCVPDPSCLEFTIFDSFGDGICCNYGNGSYTVKYGGVTQATGGQFGFSETVPFGQCTPGTNCSYPSPVAVGTHTAPNRDFWYEFTPTATGQYHINTCSSSCDTKIWVYDYCTGLVWDNSNAGTIYYNDDLCGVQSEVFPNLIAGSTYYIRIGDKNASCSSSINWELAYLGPVRGCMDTLACNYEPLASLPDTCFYPGNPNCPNGPDLLVVQSAIENTIYVSSINNTDGCSIAEGCTGGYGIRDVIRFDTHIKNIGDEDYYIGAPPSVPGQFTFDNCHNHWHYEGYAEYLLYDANNNSLPIGFKNGFCVMDLECSGGGSFTYGCSDMGISSGCGDIYSAGLDCQWVDITDIPAGDYTLVVRVNWDRSPDALGRVETSFANNHAQVCFTLSRAPVTGTPSITLKPTCPLITDCMGVPLGSATMDCNGVCNGSALHGDLDANGMRNQSDAEAYVDNIINAGPVAATPCVDLNNDATVSVYDAALVASCGLFTSGHPHNGGGLHDHCQFPRGITNPNDSMFFSISNIDYGAQYFDIALRNPHAGVVGYQLKLSGVDISSLTSLVNATQFPADIDFNANGELIVLSYVDSSIQKQTASVPILRVHYSAITATQICIDQVVDAVSHKYEQPVNVIVNGCLPGVATGTEGFGASSAVWVYPNPFTHTTRMDFGRAPSADGAHVRIWDVSGKLVREYAQVTSRVLEIPRGALQSGIYLYEVSGGVVGRGKLIIY